MIKPVRVLRENREEMGGGSDGLGCVDCYCIVLGGDADGKGLGGIGSKLGIFVCKGMLLGGGGRNYRVSIVTRYAKIAVC